MKTDFLVHVNNLRLLNVLAYEKNLISQEQKSKLDKVLMEYVKTCRKEYLDTVLYFNDGNITQMERNHLIELSERKTLKEHLNTVNLKNKEVDKWQEIKGSTRKIR